MTLSQPFGPEEGDRRLVSDTPARFVGLAGWSYRADPLPFIHSTRGLKVEIDGFGTLINPDELDWIETPGGNSIKVLRVSEETGSYTALFKAEKGTVNPPHIHLGPADFYVISGVMEYRGGVSRAGDWIYEPNGAEHEATSHPEETIYLANVHGPIVFYGEPEGEAEDGGERPILAISDWRGMKALQAMHKSSARS